jgi:hypothetical protein
MSTTTCRCKEDGMLQMRPALQWKTRNFIRAIWCNILLQFPWFIHQDITDKLLLIGFYSRMDKHCTHDVTRWTSRLCCLPHELSYAKSCPMKRFGSVCRCDKHGDWKAESHLCNMMQHVNSIVVGLVHQGINYQHTCSNWTMGCTVA